MCDIALNRPSCLSIYKFVELKNARTPWHMIFIALMDGTKSLDLTGNEAASKSLVNDVRSFTASGTFCLSSGDSIELISLSG